MNELIEKQIDDWVSTNIVGEFTFRKYQKEAICGIIDNIVNTKKNHNHVIEAPTGSGKSIIIIIAAGVLHEYYGLTSYILCSDLYLWDQYATFIKNNHSIHFKFGMIKGQTGNYECSINHEDMKNADCRLGNVSWASLFNKEKARALGYPCAERCEYVKARKKAIQAGVTLMTYQLFLYQMQNAADPKKKAFAPRDIIFCDECHNLPDIVQTKMSPILQEKDLEKYVEIYRYAYNKRYQLGIFSDNEESGELLEKFKTEQDFINGYYDIFNVFADENAIKPDIVKALTDYDTFLGLMRDTAEEIIDDIAKRKENHLPISKEDIFIFKKVSFLTNFHCHWNDFLRAISDAGIEYLIRQVDKNKEGKPVVTLNCLKEDYMVWHYLLACANFRVMLSATVGGKLPFEENSGIKLYSDEKESLYEVIPSTFNFDKSPVHFINRYKMNFAERDKSFEALKPIIYQIINSFKGRKGIIQTGNYDLARKLKFYAPPEIQQRLLDYDGSRDKINTITTHRLMTDTILIGPTLCEGVDLPDDDCRFIIILKMPYPNIKDHYVYEKTRLFPLWYNSKTSTQIIQGIGRGIRNENDYCVTYILDACFYNLYINTKDQYSPELQARIKMY